MNHRIRKFKMIQEAYSRSSLFRIEPSANNSSTIAVITCRTFGPVDRNPKARDEKPVTWARETLLRAAKRGARQN